MSDIFISYSSKDRPWVEQFAKVLAARGWSVWWDREIPTGQTFDTVIEQALESAKCAIVVWSEYSVASKWVRSEAADALERMSFYRFESMMRNCRWNSGAFKPSL